VIYGNAEEEAGTVTVRDMTTGEQASVLAGDLAAHFAELAAGLGG
jgi:histidyl-tRNA synthetase